MASSRLRLIRAAAGLLVGVLAGLPAVTWAQPAPPPLPGNVHVVASGLVNPRGFTWGPDGSLYVIESGTPPAGFVPPSGPPQPDSPPVTNNNGRILRFGPGGARTVLVSGLPVVVGPLGDTVGGASLAFLGDQLYAAISAGPRHGHPEMAGGVYLVDAGKLTLIADTDAYNIDNPSIHSNHGDSSDELSNLYDMIALDNQLYITDGNHDVVHVVDPAAPEGERISRLADLSTGHRVLTGIAGGPDGNLYVSDLTSAPFPAESAQIFQITPDGAITPVVSGVSAGAGLAAAPDGSMYVSEIASTLGVPPFLVPPGRIMRVVGARVEPLAAPLMFPTILRWGPDGLYASVFSVGGDAGTGMIVRIDT
ncbi:MAG: ScyD/ScyE family protein [Chloroflexota bacterium]